MNHAWLYELTSRKYKKNDRCRFLAKFWFLAMANWYVKPILGLEKHDNLKN